MTPRFASAALAIGLAAGPGQAQQADGPDTLRETFRDWTLQCRQPGNENRSCEIVQRINQEGSGRRLLTISIRYNAEDEAAATIITPFGLRLSDGVEVTADDSVLGRYEFDTCLSQGCLVVAPVDGKTATTMREADSGEVRAVTRQGESFAIPVSFEGFSAALDRLRSFSEG